MKVEADKYDIIFRPESTLDAYKLGAIFGWPEKAARPFAWNGESDSSEQMQVEGIRVQKKDLLQWFICDGNTAKEAK